MLLCRAQFKRNKGSQAPVLDELQKYFRDVWCELCATQLLQCRKNAAIPSLSWLHCSIRNRSCWMISGCPEINKYSAARCCSNTRLQWSHMIVAQAATKRLQSTQWWVEIPVASRISRVFSAFLAIKWMPLELHEIHLSLHEIHLSRKSGPKILLKLHHVAFCRSCCTPGRVFVAIIKLELHSSWPLGEGIGKEMVTQLMRSQLVKLQCQLRVLLVLDESKDCT